MTLLRAFAARRSSPVEPRVLVEDREPRLYLYAQTLGEHRQVGVVACVQVKDHVLGLVRGHAPVRDEEVAARARHIEALRAHDEPVLLSYRAEGAIDAIVAEATRAAPAQSFTSEDGVEHQVWVLDLETTRALSARFAWADRRDEAVPALYILAGHHLAAAATRAHHTLRGRLGGEDDVFLAVVVPHDQVRIRAHDRLVRDPEGRSPGALLGRLREALDVEEVADGAAAAPAPRTFGVYLGGRWYRARPRPGTFDAKDPADSLDASICQAQILHAIFGVPFSQPEGRVDLLTGDQGHAALAGRVDAGEHAMAIRLSPPSIDQIFAVADAKRVLPPRSVWVAPRPWGGLFVHTF